jgi:clan AA aspartic protease
MGHVYADLKLTNFMNKQAMTVRSLVDTGATYMCITPAQALQLGFDLSEADKRLTTMADGRQVPVPVVAPITIEFENRRHTTEAMVLGDEPLMGVLILEAMDILVDPLRQKLVVNPEHPNVPVFKAK